ncbi:MAG: hypothetical protein AAF738_02210 [Bacteroidota bacterium]
MRFIFTLTLFILFFQTGNTQYFKGQESFNQLLKKADAAYENGEELYALEYTRRAAYMDTTRLDLWYKVATLAHDLTIIDLAKEAYAMAAKHDARANYPLLDLKHGNLLKLFGEYDTAKKSYQRFLREYSQSATINNDLLTQAKKAMAQCDKPPLLHHETMKAVKRVDMSMNAPCRSTFAPYVEGNDLYFTSLFYPADVDTTDLRNAKLNIFQQQLNSSQAPQILGDDEGRSAHFALSLDKQKLYYTVCDYQKTGKYQCAIYRSNRNTNGTWGLGKILPKPINLLNTTNTHPAIGIDTDGQEVLLFSSNRERTDGSTDMDIWQSRIRTEQDGSLTYEEVKNLTKVNTKADEVTPFYHLGCQTLYFSTNGRNSLGELDIYQTRRNGKRWGQVEQMPYPVNTSFNDSYFFRTEDGSKAYFASNRVTTEDLETQDCKGCCPKIYEAPIITPVSLDVLAFCGTQSLDSLTYNMQAGDLVVKGATYDAPIELIPNTTYALQLQKENYKTTSFEFITEGFCDSTVLQQQVYMYPKENLTIQVFGENRNGTQQIALLDKVTFLGEEDRSFEVLKNVATEDLKFTIQPNTNYKLVAEKEGYKKDSIQIRAISPDKLCLLETGITLKMDEDLAVSPRITGTSKIPELERLIKETLPLPATLYFHNAIPAIENRRKLGSANISYKTTYEDYLQRIQNYKTQLTQYYENENKMEKAAAAANSLDLFFLNRVQRGYEILKLYASALELYMKKGKTAQICIQGTASPLASATYNRYLSERRINSVRNFLKEYKEGVLAPYIGTKLTIKELPLGEAQGTPQMENRSFGIYAPESAALRNVTIIDIQAQGATGCEPLEE